VSAVRAVVSIESERLGNALTHHTSKRQMVVSLSLVFIEFYLRLLLLGQLLGIYDNLTGRNLIQKVVIVFHLVQILSAIELGVSRIFMIETK